VRLAFTLRLGLAALTLALAAAAPAHAASPAVGALKVDQSVTPLGMDDPHPSLSWQLSSSEANVRQSAYRVLVASSPDLQQPVWDSGKVASGESVGVAYDGPALASGHRYYWAVQVWDQADQASAWSAPTWFETGLLSAADWGGAQWITPDAGDRRSWTDFTLDADFTLKSGAATVLFRAANASTFYMWQINAVLQQGKVLLRPHTAVNGSYANIAEVDLAPVLTPANASQPHHLRIQVAGSTITTWIDGTQVDTRTDTTIAGKGTIGFRNSSTNGIAERAAWDNLVVRAPDGTVLFSDDVASTPDPAFPQTPVVDGQLEPGDGVTLLATTADAPVLRHDFTLDKPVAGARAYVYGLGLAELHLNGAKVGDRALTPTASQYGQRSLYNVYDVTDALRQGANTVGLWLGNGYNANYSQYAFRYLGAKKAIMLLRVTFTDGTTRDITTSPDGWKWSTDAIAANDLYNGESYDARLHRPWDRPGFDDAAWDPVQATTAPSGRLVASLTAPVRAVQTLKPVALTQPRPGVYVFDLGQNIAGWERLHVDGPAGTRVQLRTAEELGADGLLDTVTNRNARATDTYTLAGGGPETYEPRFTYHGFRYVEVTGYPGTPTLDSLKGIVAHADVESTGRFESSDALLNRIWTMNRWGILNNSMSTPTDTPVRDERTPPAMDVQAYADASTREFDMDRFYAKYLEDLPPGTALPTDDAKAQYPDMAGGQVALAWTLYEQYGGRATLAANYPLMKAFVDRNAADKPSHIWPANEGFGDWCPPVHGDAANGGLGSPSAGDCFSEVSIVSTALAYKQADVTARAAQALGHADEAAHYRRLADDIKTAFNAAFLKGDVYGDGRQTTSILPLAFGMVPAANVQAVGDRLVQNILTDNGGHLDTGIFGTRSLVDALAAIGRIDVAMTVLGQTTYPGFGYELSKGATTPWEEWTYFSGMETHDHAMFAGVNASLYTRLAGITPASPGYATIDIAPQVPPGLAHAAASLDTVRGTVSSSWTQTAHTLDLEVRVPANATATVHVPVRAGQIVTTAAAGTGTPGVYTVGSGTWTLTVQPGVEAPETVGGTVPPTLALTLGAPASFGAFTPGVEQTYTASTTATVTSTAGDARLSVDGGRLANGAFTLSEPLQVAFSKASWSGPVANDAVTIGFEQHIGATEPLRTGIYSRSLTFTLSTTTP
jgi:alpha-L-rhamnosidase